MAPALWGHTWTAVGGTDISSNIPEMAALARDLKEGPSAQHECVLGSEVFLQERM